jgi:YesN/AraC family two-component response regulator
MAASSTIVAMRILAQEHVDVLLADVVMPDEDGIELAREAKLLRPNLHIIFVTGYVERAAAAGALGKLMFKPLRAREIENALEEVRLGRG